jgi:hypothetical protein
MGTISSGDLLPEFTDPSELSSAGELVIEKFNTSKEVSENLWNTAIDAFETLKNMTFDIAIDEETFNELDPTQLSSLSLNAPIAPDISGIAVDWPTYDPSIPEGYDPDIESPTIPEMNVPDPGIDIPSAPDVPWPDTNVDPPGIANIAIPSPPSDSIPPIPSLDFDEVPSPPEYNVIEFDHEAPTDELTPPETEFYWNEAEYNSAVYEYLREKLYNELVSGGTGLDDATEQAIYDRATARQELENQKLYDNALNFFASRGAPLPPGALNGALIEVDYKIAQVREDLNNDILIQQSKLAQENTHFIITSAINLERMAIEYCNAYQQRAFEAAKYAVESAHSLYLMKAEALKIKTQIYQILAQVYEARIRGEVAKAELYKARIAGLEASTNIKRAMVELYLAQIKGVEVLYNCYKTEMEGAAIQAQIEGLKIERFKGIVNALEVQVRAAVGKYTGYATQMQGEAIKADVHKSLVQAYGEEVKAIVSKTNADVNIANVNLASVQSKVEVLKALVQKYGMDINAKAVEVDSEVKIAGMETDLFKAETSKYAAEIDGVVRNYLGKVEELKSINTATVQQMDVLAKTLLGQYGLAVEVSKGISQVAGQLGAAAFAGVSASAHIGHGESRSDTATWSRSISESYIEQHSSSHVNQYIYYHERD